MKIKWRPKTKTERAGIRAIKLLQAQGFQAFWIGGVVRNELLKRSSDNVDVATDALPEQVEKLLDRAGIKNKPVGKKFGSILAIINATVVEITSFRTEGSYGDQRHPDQIEFIKEYLEDAKRRDFTVNALYFDPIKKELFDPIGGLRDLKKKTLKLVGDPKKRIQEDPLRMLRGVRLATQLGFKLDLQSFAAIKALAKNILSVSKERVKAELDKILLSENRVIGLMLLDESGLLKFILPELEKLKTIRHNATTFHLEGSVFVHTMKAMGLLKINDLDLVYVILFHDAGKVIKPTKIPDNNPKGWRWSFKGHVQLSGKLFEKFAKKYHFPKASKARIMSMIAHHEDRTKFQKMTELTQVKYLLSVPEPEMLFEVWRVDSAANLRLENGKKVWGHTKSVLIGKKLLQKIKNTRKLFHLADGNLIMKHAKFKPNRQLGEKILEIKSQIVVGKIKNEDELKNYLKNPEKVLDKQSKYLYDLSKS